MEMSADIFFLIGPLSSVMGPSVQLIIYYLSFQNITFLINLMGELVYLLHNLVKQPPISLLFNVFRSNVLSLKAPWMGIGLHDSTYCPSLLEFFTCQNHIKYINFFVQGIFRKYPP